MANVFVDNQASALGSRRGGVSYIIPNFPNFGPQTGENRTGGFEHLLQILCSASLSGVAHGGQQTEPKANHPQMCVLVIRSYDRLRL